MNRAIVLAACVAAFAFVILAPQQAQASLQICNNSSERVDTAVAYYEDLGIVDGWVSDGWWVLEPGGCAVPVSGDLENRYYYVYGNGQSHYWSGNYNFCVDTQAKFDFVDADSSCPNGAYRGFRQIDTENSKSYTWSFSD